MGLFKRVFRPIRKVAKKIIPKEVRPFLPYIAASFGPATAGLTGTAFAKAATQRALLAAATSAATDEQGDPLRAGILAVTPDLIGAGTAKLAGGDGRIAEFLTKTKKLKDGKETISLAETIASATNPETAMGKAKLLGTQAAIDQSAKFAEIRQDEIDEYNRSLREQGVLDKSKRRSAILNIYRNAGYDDDYVNSMLDRYGYDEGGLAKLREQFKTLMSKMKAPETVAKQMKGNLRRKSKDDDMVIPLEKPKKDDEDEKPVPVRDVSRDDLAGGLMAAADGVQKAFGRSFGNMEPVPMLRFARGGKVINYESYKDFIESTGDDELMDLYIEFLGTGDFTKLGDALKRKGYAKGGEIEIEEETDDLSIMDFMKDQGIPYGEQASYGYNEAMSDTFDMFLDMKKNGLIPPTMEFDEFLQDVVPEMGSRRREGIMQMAKSDIEEMYEQYVFEMEEMGLEPMSFSEFLAREKAGMADGGKVKRRKKGEPADEIIETEEEIFIDKMPKPKRQGIMEAADGGIMEKDMRGGGFIPEGSKEKADDVPARLSKNEFVMTADAVRAAGGGSVNKGAKRMYDLMYNLEGRI